MIERVEYFYSSKVPEADTMPSWASVEKIKDDLFIVYAIINHPEFFRAVDALENNGEKNITGEEFFGKFGFKLLHLEPDVINAN